MSSDPQDVRRPIFESLGVAPVPTHPWPIVT